MRRLIAVVLLAILAACGNDEPADCTPQPERITDESLAARNLIEPLPSPGSDPSLQFEAAGVDVQFLTRGDLDGDGRDEHLVTAGEEVYAVDGRTPSGRHDPREVGVRLDPDWKQVWPGDLEGTPGGDVVVLVRSDGRSYTDVWSGAAIVGRGAGGDARALEPARRLRGLLRARVPLAKGGPHETILYDPGTPAAVRVVERPKLVLRALGRASRVEDIVVFDEGGERKIALQIDRQAAVWPVPDDCR